MYKVQPILKKYYDSLEEGKVLGMKCKECKAVVWPPLPTCQKCFSTDLEWLELSKEAIIEEISFEGTIEGNNDHFKKTNPYFVSDEPYCLCTGRIKEDTPFTAALFGVNRDNVDDLISKLPINAKVEFIQCEGGFKSVGFRIKS